MTQSHLTLKLRLIMAAMLAVMSIQQGVAQRELSQNQDGFESNLYEGNLNATPQRDSTVIQREVPKDYSQWTINPLTGLMDPMEPDTAQYLFHNTHKNEGLEGTYNNLSSSGTPRVSRLFSERDGNRAFFFDKPYSLFVKDPTEFRFTDTKTPHVNITYFSGGGQQTGEDHLKGYFSANFGRKFGIGFNMDYLHSSGRYSNQATSLFDTRIYGYYHGDLYSAHLSFNTDLMKVTENGGITDDRYISNPIAMAEGRKQYDAEEIPVRLQSNWNELRRRQFLVNQKLDIRKSYLRTDSIGDTIITRTSYKELGSIANTTEFGFMNRTFIAYTSPANYYRYEWLKDDSLDTFKDFYLDNTLSFNLNEGFSKWAVAGLKAFARYEFRSHSMADTLADGKRTETLNRQNEFNIAIGASIQRETGKHLDLNVSAQTVLLGSRFGDFDLSGGIGYRFRLMKQDAGITARVQFNGSTPDYYMRHFHSQHYWWDTELKKEITTRVEGELKIERWHTRLTVGVTNLNNYTYFSDNGAITNEGTSISDITINQCDEGIQVIDATLHQDFSLGILHWDNAVTWQTSSNKEVLPLPMLNVFSNLYLKFLYAKRLRLEIGADVTWFTSYYAPNYSPALGQFHIQNEQNRIEVGNYPLVNVYLNCVLRGVRLYVMLYHVNSGMTVESGGPYWAPHYPINPRMLQFGVSWTFFD
ncbi:MAG: putative porin [Bacteroidaceae bacterium]|nr:putative porin [Bacteroidaceae bacterium]